jgi:hypothetical protein
MDGNVSSTVQERLLDLLEKQTFSADRSEGTIDDPIAGRDDVQLLHLDLGEPLREFLEELAALS